MAFADPIELAAYLSTTFDDGAATQAQLLLDIATAEIQGYTGQTFDLVDDDEVTLDAPAGDVVFLPEMPVVDVTSVVVDSTALNVDEFAWYDYGAVYRTGAIWWASSTSGRQKIVVTYTHGYEDVPADLKGVCLSLAGRLLEGKSGYTVDTEGNPENASTTERAGVLGEFTDAERAVMDRYRVVAVA